MAAACVSALLIKGRADPAKVDSRNRVPYFLAKDEKTREAFRKARAVLGEHLFDWASAKVGPPLSESEITLKKEKEAEKRRQKRIRQKQKKRISETRSNVDINTRDTGETDQTHQDAVTTKLLDPKAICDFCKKECKGRKRKMMLKRLEYSYCSTECVQKHKRDLMAKAAMDRFS